jgi:hypothetical protein
VEGPTSETFARTPEGARGDAKPLSISVPPTSMGAPLSRSPNGNALPTNSPAAAARETAATVALAAARGVAAATAGVSTVPPVPLPTFQKKVLAGHLQLELLELIEERLLGPGGVKATPVETLAPVLSKSLLRAKVWARGRWGGVKGMYEPCETAGY